MLNHIAITTCNAILHNLYFFHFFKEQYSLLEKPEISGSIMALIYDFYEVLWWR